EALYEVVVAERVTQSKESGRTEGLAGHDGDLDGLEEHLGEFTRTLRHSRAQRASEESAHVGKAVESAVGQGATHTVNGVQHRRHDLSATIEGFTHLFHGEQVARQSCDGSALGNV